MWPFNRNLRMRIAALEDEEVAREVQKTIDADDGSRFDITGEQVELSTSERLKGIEEDVEAIRDRLWHMQEILQKLCPHDEKKCETCGDMLPSDE